MVKAIMCVRLTKDIEVKTTANGKTYAQFSGASDTGFGDNKKSNFYNFSAFGKTAETLAKFTAKGQKILLDCEPQQNTWTDKDGNKRDQIVFVVNGMEFVEKKGTSNTQNTSVAGTDFMSVPDNIDEEMPFN